jgi:DNA-binding MarR family transcriptional regulator
MSSISQSLKVLMNLNFVQSIAARKLDNRLGLHGVSLNDLTILFQLGQAADEKLRRTDLAEKIGLTASGVTRILVPLEKAGLIRREVNSRDARVSYVKLAPAGKRILTEGLATAESTADQFLGSIKAKRLDEFYQLLVELGGNI